MFTGQYCVLQFYTTQKGRHAEANDSRNKWSVVLTGSQQEDLCFTFPG